MGVLPLSVVHVQTLSLMLEVEVPVSHQGGGVTLLDKNGEFAQPSWGITKLRLLVVQLTVLLKANWFIICPGL